VGEEIILPFGKPRAVADYLLGRQTPVLCDGRKAEVEMGRFLVHVDGGGEDIIPADPLGEEVNRSLEKGLDFHPFLALEELRAGGDERVHKADAILAGFAPRRLDAVVHLSPVGSLRLDDVEVPALAVGVNVGVAGVLLFLAFVVGFECRPAALVLGKSHYCVLWYGDSPFI